MINKTESRQKAYILRIGVVSLKKKKRRKKKRKYNFFCNQNTSRNYPKIDLLTELKFQDAL